MTNRPLQVLLRATVVAALLLAAYLVRSRSTVGTPAGRDTAGVWPARDTVHPSVLPPLGTSADEISAAFRAKRSDVLVQGGGRVVRVLADDRDGSRHERFIVRVDGGISVLIAHNIDLAPRVPVVAGDSVELRGEYAWNAKGGVVHWTHRDPDGSHEPGWIRHAGRVYQ